MYMPEHSSTHGLQTKGGKDIALQSVNVAVIFNSLLCETTMTQVYRNLEAKPIEAVYTFPLASRAVLMGLKVTIGGRELQGKVVAKAEAEEQYEKAIVEGDAAIMLEQPEPGMYTINVGNILADEEVQVTIQYAELYAWQGDTIRFHLPTTIAPRYGNPASAGLQPHQVPEYDLLAENRFQLMLTLMGPLANARLDCPSHRIVITNSTSATVVTLAAGEAFMDRDFILNIRLAGSEKDAVLLDRDFDGGYVALASFAPILPIPEEIPPRSVKIVVDCSGSMSGDSITQARQAISDILDQLRPEDFFNLVAFGSKYTTYFDRQVQADKKNITRVRRQLRSLDADMGGTEMGTALLAAVQLSGPPIPQDILLITDGEIWEGDELTGKMKQSGHRVFTVGVGSSVSEGFVRQLALDTGGSCELVVPNEEMTEKIVRHFRRIYLPRAEKVAVRWPVEPVQIIPSNIGPVFDGDTLHVFACFREKPRGRVSLDMVLADGRSFTQNVVLEGEEEVVSISDPAGTLARMAMYQTLADKDAMDAMELAVRYQLISPYTNYLVVDVRAEDEKGEELPDLRKVPQMLAAGWGGTGEVESFASNALYNKHYDYEDVEIEALCPSEQGEWCRRTTPKVFIFKCNLLGADIDNFADLRDRSLPERIVDVLRSIAEQYDPEAPEEVIVVTFLFMLTQSIVGGEFDRKSKRVINKAMKILHPDQRLINIMSEAFAYISEEDWGKQYPMEEEA
ncbi:MAG: VIT and VWA domain-containing protein [Desulfobulbaceae bacterium]|nr:VIT and VWA domain-containing protein [Desulfobulbaceae bacterium]